MIDTVRELSFVKLLLTVNAINRVVMPPGCSTIDVLHVKNEFCIFIYKFTPFRYKINNCFAYESQHITFFPFFLLLNSTSINEPLVVLKHAFDVEILAL